MGFIAAVLLILVSLIHSEDGWAEQKDPCKLWFDKTKLKANENCLLKCASAAVDMTTFECPNHCDDFCDSPRSQAYVFQLSDLYPGLSPAEKALAAKFPGKALRAYQLSWEAEKVCAREYSVSNTNDGSDACRHFIWAAMLTDEMKPALAQQILDAHEQEPTQPTDQKAMDLANNQRGVSFATAHPQSSQSEMLSEFRRLLQEGKLVTLTKGNK